MTAAKILVIGSAHLDIIAEFNDAGQENAVDKIGSRIDFGFGGTALNTAAWLQDFGHKPCLLTAVNKSSFTGRAVLSAMRAGGLSCKGVVDDTRLRDSAFVAAIKDKSLHSAVSCMEISESERIIGRLDSMIPKFDWVMFDCNLSRSAIGKIAEICRDRGVNAIGAATSDAKVTLLLATQQHGTRALCMNHREAAVLNAELGISDTDLGQLRSALNTETLLMTAGADGMYIVDSDVAHYPPPAGVVPETTIGAGDAACAGLLNALARGGSVPDEIDRAVTHALRSRFPTKFSERTAPDALHKYARDRRRNLSVLRALGFGAAIVAGWSIELGLQSILEFLFG